MTRPTLIKRSEAGFFTIWVLGLCTMILFLGGISFDLWHGFSEKRAAAASVDGAAIAGASQIDLDRFKADGTVVLLPNQAVAAANAYLDNAQTDTGQTYYNRDITVDADGTLLVTASSKFSFTLIKVLLPNAADGEVRVTGAADPRQAG